MKRSLPNVSKGPAKHCIMDMGERLTKEGLPVAVRAELKAISGKSHAAVKARKPLYLGRMVDEDDATPKTPVGGGTGHRHA
jgi:hypothetical protein